MYLAQPVRVAPKQIYVEYRCKANQQIRLDQWRVSDHIIMNHLLHQVINHLAYDVQPHAADHLVDLEGRRIDSAAVIQDNQILRLYLIYNEYSYSDVWSGRWIYYEQERQNLIASKISQRQRDRERVGIEELIWRIIEQEEQEKRSAAENQQSLQTPSTINPMNDLLPHTNSTIQIDHPVLPVVTVPTNQENTVLNYELVVHSDNDKEVRGAVIEPMTEQVVIEVKINPSEQISEPQLEAPREDKTEEKKIIVQEHIIEMKQMEEDDKKIEQTPPTEEQNAVTYSVIVVPENQQQQREDDAQIIRERELERLEELINKKKKQGEMINQKLQEKKKTKETNTQLNEKTEQKEKDEKNKENEEKIKENKEEIKIIVVAIDPAPKNDVVRKEEHQLRTSEDGGPVYYSLEEIKEKRMHLNQKILESYLTDADFQVIFQVTKPAFYKMKLWKQHQEKKRVGLF
eukprot:TRINITY_DN4576_c0_g1_i1.p1 TRINITY_DN4576_c0_g1~~TRINITY_DN4576_c0_g1_i1.p1  ORF type:complete len:459 (-),score=116.44 TRINITY_DN4576_c0_g1_i1:10-1386(-)